jgi:hypothetical protein
MSYFAIFHVNNICLLPSLFLSARKCLFCLSSVRGCVARGSYSTPCARFFREGVRKPPEPPHGQAHCVEQLPRIPAVATSFPGAFFLKRLFRAHYALWRKNAIHRKVYFIERIHFIARTRTLNMTLRGEGIAVPRSVTPARGFGAVSEFPRRKSAHTEWTSCPLSPHPKRLLTGSLGYANRL